MKFLFLIVLFLQGCLGCTEEGPTVGTTHTPNFLSGHVVKEDGKGFADVMVYISENDNEVSLYKVGRADGVSDAIDSALTDSVGYYQFDELVSGNYEIVGLYKDVTVFVSDVEGYDSEEGKEVDIIISEDLFSDIILEVEELDSIKNSTPVDTSSSDDSTDTEVDQDDALAEMTLGKALIPGGDVDVEVIDAGYDRFTYDVSVTGFYMDSATVTVKEFFTYFDTTVHTYTAPSNIDENAPITQVTWNQAIFYCNEKSKAMGLDTVYTYDSLYYEYGDLILSNPVTDFTKEGLRLPTLAEWSFASKGGVDTDYFWGDDSLEYGDYAQSQEDNSVVASGMPDVVKGKLPNGYGLYDMIGNGGEYCNDFSSPSDDTKYDDAYGGNPTDPIGVDRVAYPEPNPLVDIMLVGRATTSYTQFFMYKAAFEQNQISPDSYVSFRTIIRVEE